MAEHVRLSPNRRHSLADVRFSPDLVRFTPENGPMARASAESVREKLGHVADGFRVVPSLYQSLHDPIEGFFCDHGTPPHSYVPTPELIVLRGFGDIVTKRRRRPSAASFKCARHASHGQRFSVQKIFGEKPAGRKGPTSEPPAPVRLTPPFSHGTQ